MRNERDSEAHGGHRARLRQRVQSEGLEGLEPHELIEFLLFYAIPRQDVNELAHRLIARFGGIRGVLEAEPAELERVSGVGGRTAEWLALLGEAASACARLSPEDRPALRNCMDAFRYAARLGRELEPPCSVQLCLDRAGRMLYRGPVCASLSWGEPAAMRAALCDVLGVRAHCAILLLLMRDRAPEPGPYDIRHAAVYADALRSAECELLDVILVGGDALFSMRRGGMIPSGGEPASARALREDYMLHMPAEELRLQDFRAPD